MLVNVHAGLWPAWCDREMDLHALEAMLSVLIWTWLKEPEYAAQAARFSNVGAQVVGSIHLLGCPNICTSWHLASILEAT